VSTDKDKSDDDDAPRWAADEPTAMWDDSMMREAGYEAVANAPPRPEAGPATDRGVKGEDKRAVHVSAELTGGHKAIAPTPAAAPKSSGTSWVITLALAIGLGVAAYFVVRFLR
jgi:hypothetical protein